MLDFLARLFDPAGFPPRWQCGVWTPAHGWLHILSDLGVWSAYFAIPLVLWYCARRRADLPFRHLAWLFGAFILLCGTTHLMEAVIFWWPAYRLAGALKLATAVVSWVTVMALFRVTPGLLAMRSPDELKREAAARRAAEDGQARALADLGETVRALTCANAALKSERERFLTILTGIGDGVVAAGPDGRVTFLNPAAEALTGWPATEAVGQPLPAVYHVVRGPADAPATAESAGESERRIVLSTRDGRERVVDDSASPPPDESGSAVVVLRDVTAEVQARQTEAEKARLTALRADIATALASSQPQVAVLQACCEAFVAHLGATFARLWTLPDGGDTLELIASAGLYTHTDGPHGRIKVGQYKIGRIAAAAQPHLTNSVADDPEISDPAWAAREGIVAFAGHPLAVEGRVVGVVGLFARRPLPDAVLSVIARSAGRIAQYIDRRRAEDRLRASEERYRLLFDESPLPMWVSDQATLSFVAVNAAMVAKYGYSRDEFLDMRATDVRLPEDTPALMAALQEGDWQGSGRLWRHRLKSGQLIQVRVVLHAITYRDRPCWLGQAVDVTEQLRAEAALRESEERYRLMFDECPLPMWVFDRERLTFLEVNPTAVAKYGYSRDEFLGMTLKDIRPPEDWPALLADVATPDLPDLARVWRHRLKDGRAIQVRVAAHPFTYGDRPARLVQVIDVTDQLRLEEQVRASEGKLRALFESPMLGAFYWDTDGGMSDANDGLLAMVGYTRADMEAGRVNWRHLTPDEYRAADEVALRELADSSVFTPFEKEYFRKDGGRVPILLGGAFLPGSRKHGVSYAIDLTARRQAELAHRESEERYRSLFAAMSEGVAFVAPDMTILECNASAERILGLAPGGLSGRASDDPGWGAVHEDGTPFRADDLPTRVTMRTGRACQNVVMGVGRPDGTRVWLSLNTEPLAPNGAVGPAGVACSFTDITERKRAADALRASERLLRRVIDTDPSFIVVKDEGGRFTLANRAMADAYGTTPEAMIGRTDADFEPVAGEVDRYRAADRAVLAQGADFFDPQEPFTTAAGERRWLRTTKRPLEDEAGRRASVLIVAVDITAETQAADALAAANRQYRLLADHMSDVVGLVGADGVLQHISPSCERLLGYPAAGLVTDGWGGLVHPDDRGATAAAWAAAHAGRELTFEWRCRHRDGHHLWLETVLTPIRSADGTVSQVVAAGRDVTARRAAEEQLRQAQKLEAVGQLAGGVAHDFNNLLTVVNGCGDLLLADLPPGSPARPLAEAIIGAGQRGAGLTRQLLAFSRQQMLRVEVFDTVVVLPETAKLLARLLGEDVALRLDLDPAAGCLRADVGQVEQVVINLAVNARDAMPRGGTLTIRTAAADYAEGEPLPSPDARPGRYVRLAVTDTGTGIPPDVLARIFEPFFTTKPAGKGTGLGLATVYGIVRQSGGFLTVESVVGRGTTFAVHLPRHDPEASVPKSDLRPKPKAAGSETVLLVEDDESVRALATAILSRQGYRVVAAADGEAALAACDRLATPPDVVLTDVVMPGMSGRELAEILTARYPRLSVVYLSGYTADDVLRHGVEEERVSFLQKPYTPDSLARLVRQVLDGLGQGHPIQNGVSPTALDG